MPKVSVILPIYNVELYIERCLDCLINQTFKDMEIICVDDCSTDKTMQIAEKYKEKDNRIKTVYREKNGGVSAARNTGLDCAIGKYVYFLDPDDWINSDYIEKMLDAAETQNAKVVCNTNIITYDFNNKILKYPDPRLRKAYKNVWIDTKQEVCRIMWTAWCYFIDRQFLLDTKIRFFEGYCYEDKYFQALLFMYIDKVYVIQESCYHYCGRETSICGFLKKDFIKSDELELITSEMIYDYYKAHNMLDFVKIKLFELPKAKNENEIKNSYCKYRKFFNKIKDYFYQTLNIYDETEIRFFNDIVNNYNYALTQYYWKDYIFSKLRDFIRVKNDIDSKGITNAG